MGNEKAERSRTCASSWWQKVRDKDSRMTLLGDCQRRGGDHRFPYFKIRACFKCPEVSYLLYEKVGWSLFLSWQNWRAVWVIICHLLSTAVQLLKSPLEAGVEGERAHSWRKVECTFRGRFSWASAQLIPFAHRDKAATNSNWFWNESV